MKNTCGVVGKKVLMNKERTFRRLAHRALASYYSERKLLENRVTGHPWGSGIPVAVCYPNSYAIGMSNLGLFALLNIINNYGGFIAERVFFEKDYNEEALSVESHRPLSDYAHLFFTVSFEPDFFNLAALLKRSNVPLWAKDRRQGDPLVIGGGASLSANPAPVQDFLDVVCIGEAEAIMPSILRILKSGATRRQLLEHLVELDGIYVPGISKSSIQRTYKRELTSPPFTSLVTPYSQSGGAFMIEISRSCPFHCTFCLAKSAFSPFRYYSWDSIKNTLQNRPDNAKVWLVGAAAYAHPQIETISEYLVQNDISFSISALRSKPLSVKLLQNLRQSGQQSLSLAPESGATMRQKMGKDISDNDFIQTVETAVGLGFNEIKLYFMVGLPHETERDLLELIDLCLACAKTAKSARIFVSVSPFVAKVGTPWENQSWGGIRQIKCTIDYLQKALGKRGIEVKPESPFFSAVQALLSKGGKELSSLLAISENSTYTAIRNAFSHSKLDLDKCISELPNTPAASQIIRGEKGV